MVIFTNTLVPIYSSYELVRISQYFRSYQILLQVVFQIFHYTDIQNTLHCGSHIQSRIGENFTPLVHISYNNKLLFWNGPSLEKYH